NPESLLKAFEGIDIVFHLAARISIVKHDRDPVCKVNIDGVRNVTDACLKAGVRRLVHTSSFHAVVQEPLDEPLDETWPLVTGDRYPPYNFSKAEGERIVRSAISKGLDAVIITPSGIIGPFDYEPSLFGRTLVSLAQRKLRVLVDAGLDWVDSRDVAQAMIQAAEKANSGEKYLLSGNRGSLEEIAGYVADFMAISPPRLVLPFTIAHTVAPVVSTLDRIRGKRQLFTKISMQELNGNRCLNHEKAGRDLGYQPRLLKTTINDTLEWFLQNGYLKTGGHQAE
ncbi:MAG: NAD-dependent epimerase/dehydratase family protein, partial [Dehalococcoidia bacterium]